MGLEAPGPVRIQGTIRGIATSSEGHTTVTLSTSSLNLINLLVTPETKLANQGNATARDQLALGQRVVSGRYDPLTSRAEQLTLAAPRTLGVHGTNPAGNPVADRS